MRLWNKRRYSLWLILFLVLVIAVFNASNWYIYSKIKFYLTQQLGERLANIASATAFGVDPKKISMINQDLGAYAEIKLLLDKVQEDNQLADVFILDQDYNNVIDPALESGSDVFLNLDLAAITQALAGTKTYSHLYQVGDYMFESGFAPIYDSASHVVGVLGVEAGADFFGVLTDFRRTIILAFVLSLAGVVVLGISFYNLTSRLRKMEDAVAKNSALQAMGEMVATICHEIRNPLGIIKGTSERLRSQYQSEPNELFDFIPEEVDRLNGILTGYLEFASSEPKKKEKTDMALLVSKTAEQLRSSFSKNGIKIRLDFKENIPPVEVNPGGIRQIVINLLMNAKEAIGKGGEIRIGLACKRDFVLLEVEDNGKGIKKKDLAQLFNPFFSTKHKGSGLGLYVIKKIVEEHQGTIAVESKPGKGTKFKIVLSAGAIGQSTN
jgi:two-component system OmpR family sensor kinase